jgi:hypothetical protein
MNKTLDNYLCEKYPRIFVEREKSPRESCMGRGFECGNGWMPLIDSLCYNIQEHIDGHNKYAKQRKEARIPQFVATQVKEKFGALRIYNDGGDEYCQGLVDMAATWSWNTCELCGNGGKRLVGHTTGWIGSVCEECSKKIKRPIKFDMEIKKMLIKAVKQDLKQYVQG